MDPVDNEFATIWRIGEEASRISADDLVSLRQEYVEHLQATQKLAELQLTPENANKISHYANQVINGINNRIDTEYHTFCDERLKPLWDEPGNVVSSLRKITDPEHISKLLDLVANYKYFARVGSEGSQGMKIAQYNAINTFAESIAKKYRSESKSSESAKSLLHVVQHVRAKSYVLSRNR